MAVLFLAAFVGYAAPFCGQLNLAQQAALYNKSTVEITYFVRKSLSPAPSPYLPLPTNEPVSIGSRR